MRTLCASTLIGEFFVIGFAGLVAMKSDDLTGATVWTVCGIGMLLSVLLCGMITRPGGVQLGWALQIALVLSGFVVPMMFILGVVFAGLWWASVHYGRKIDEAKARWAAAQEAAGAPAGG
ncbi:thiol:disulfide interchange protein [Streptomyces sp. TE3672]